MYLTPQMHPSLWVYLKPFAIAKEMFHCAVKYEDSAREQKHV